MIGENSPLRLYKYIRVSTLKQKKEKTQERQERIIAKEAELRGHVLIDAFYDLAYSGKEETRPDYERMMEQIKTVEDVDGIIVADLTRFGRGGLKNIHDVVELAESGKQLIAPGSDFNTQTLKGRTSLALASIFADWQHEELVDRLAFGRQLAREKGIPFGAPKKSIPKGELEMLLMGGGSYRSIAEMYKKTEAKDRPRDRTTVARIAKEHKIEHLNRWIRGG